MKGALQVTAASLLFGLIGVLVRVLAELPTGALIFYRLAIAAAGLLLYLLLAQRGRELYLRERRYRLLLLGVWQAGAMLCYFAAIRHLSVATAVLLLYSSPLFVTLLSPFLLGEPWSARGLGALASSMSGLLLVLWPAAGLEALHGTTLVGMLAGLGSGLSMAAMVLTSRSLRESYSGIAQATWSILVTLLIFTPYAFSVPLPLVLARASLLVLFGLVPTALALILYFAGLKHVHAQTASVLSLLEPLSAITLSWLLLHEPLGLRTLLGGALIIAGALGAAWSAPASARAQARRT